MSHYMVFILIVGIIIIGAVAFVLVSSSSLQRSVEDEISVLSRSAEQTIPNPCHDEKIASLPEPVRRYLRYAMPAGGGPVRVVRMKETGQFRTDPAGEWMGSRVLSGMQQYDINPFFGSMSGIHMMEKRGICW